MIVIVQSLNSTFYQSMRGQSKRRPCSAKHVVHLLTSDTSPLKDTSIRDRKSASQRWTWVQVFVIREWQQRRLLRMTFRQTRLLRLLNVSSLPLPQSLKPSGFHLQFHRSTTVETNPGPTPSILCEPGGPPERTADSVGSTATMSVPE